MEWPRSHSARRSVVACLLAASCSYGEVATDAGLDARPRDIGPSDSGQPMDSGTADSGASGPRLEVGGGALQFEPLQTGQVVELISGPQGGGRFGGFHIWFGARIWELDPEEISAKFIILHGGDRTELARLEWVTNFRSTDSEAYEIWGATPRLSDCCLAVAQPLVMRVEVLDRDGVASSGELEVTGSSTCADTSGDLCP